MKTTWLILTIHLIMFCISINGRDMKVTTVAGLFYQDAAPVSIEIVAGKIDKIICNDKLRDPALANVFIAPGLVDNQVNGYIGVSFSSPGLTVKDVQKVTQALWKVGVTTYLPTIITSPYERFLENFAVLAEATQQPDIALSVPGFHLEGPYISPVAGYRGAHNKDWVRLPDWQEFLEVNKQAEYKILQVTLAPEVEGAIDFIRKCVEQGIVVAIGHHNASAEKIQQAVDNGAVIATHLGNGCANLIHRHENPLWPQLAEDRLMASIIVDGFHLRPYEVKTFYKVKGIGRLVIISDVTKLAGLPPGKYSWNGMSVVMTPEGMIKYPSQSVLAGASLPITRGIFNMMKFTNCSLAEAVQMATKNPALLNKLNDRGQIKVGKRADLILFSLGEDDLVIHKTIIAGKVVYSVK